MTGERNLADLLADAPKRLAEMKQQAAERPQFSEDSLLQILRGAAVLHGLDAKDVITNFEKGGALADLVRAVIGADPSLNEFDVKDRGRPKSRSVMQSLKRYQELINQGLSNSAAIHRTVDEFNVSDGTMRQRVKEWRKQGSKDPGAMLWFGDLRGR